MKLETKRTLLAPITENDLEILWQWRNSDDFREFCSCRRDGISREDFREELIRDFHFDRHEQYLIRRKTTGENIGTIFSYNLNSTDGHVFITTFVSKESRSFIGHGVEAFLLFVVHLFLEYDLHKIYTEVYEYNTRSLQIMTKCGFVQEGVFKEHRLHKAKRWDLIRLAFYLKDLEQASSLLKRLQ